MELINMKKIYDLESNKTAGMNLWNLIASGVNHTVRIADGLIDNWEYLDPDWIMSFVYDIITYDLTRQSLLDVIDGVLA